MAVFPSIPEPFHPRTGRIQFKTIMSKFDDLGEEKRKKKWLYPRRLMTLTFNYLSTSHARILWAFFIARGGSFEAFNWFDIFSNEYVGEYVGTGDGSTTNFNLPSKDASSRVLYIDGNAQTEGVNWDFTGEGGADGADLCELTTPASAGQRITFDFTGYLKVHCRFAEDYADFSIFVRTLAQTGLKLQGLLNA